MTTPVKTSTTSTSTSTSTSSSSNPSGKQTTVIQRGTQNNVIQDVPQQTFIELDIKDVSNDEVKNWVGKLYEDAIKVTDKEVLEIYDFYKYKGFDRLEVLKLMKKMISDNKTMIHLILVCSLNGPQRAAVTQLYNGKTPMQMGIPASGGQGKRVLTCNKISAATADLAAYYMKKADVPRRTDSELPGWLQFPTAGSIKLPDNLRRQHMEFSKRFSELIGGVFQIQIYEQMVRNAYLDERLNLFL
jgi:hypothetical protein